VAAFSRHTDSSVVRLGHPEFDTDASASQPNRAIYHAHASDE